MVWFNQNRASRALEKFCPALHLHLLLEPPPDFVKVLPWIFNLSLVQTLWCWLSNVEKQTWHSHNRRPDPSREVSSKECGIYACNEHFQRAIAVSIFGLLPNFSHRIETMNSRKIDIEMQILLRSLDLLNWRTLFVGTSTHAWLST